MFGFETDEEPGLTSHGNLAGSFFVSSVLAVATFFVIMRLGGEAIKTVERITEVTFVEPVAPPPPPPPPKIMRAPAPRAAAPVIPDSVKKVVVENLPPPKPLEAPKEMSKTQLAEADPSQDKGVQVLADSGPGDPAGLEGGSGKGTISANVPEAPALPEAATPPMPIDGNAMPIYPAEAKAAGRESLVILKIIIDVRGAVERVSVLRGDEPFVANAVEAVKTWHYSPATEGGKPIRIYRIIKIPFKLRT